jgi:hypothetical protein
MQHEKIIVGLKQTYQEFKKKLVLANIESEKQTQDLKA